MIIFGGLFIEAWRSFKSRESNVGALAVYFLEMIALKMLFHLHLLFLFLRYALLLMLLLFLLRKCSAFRQVFDWNSLSKFIHLFPAKLGLGVFDAIQSVLQNLDVFLLIPN
jgi:hypothetical protein